MTLTKPRIAMLLSNPFRPDTRVLKEAASLGEAGYAVNIIAWDRAAELPESSAPAPGVVVTRIHNVPSTYGIGMAQMLRLPGFWHAALGTLAQWRPDLVHCHDFDTLPCGLWWGKRQRVPVVYDAHEYYADLVRPRLPGLTGKLLYRVIRRSDLRCAHLASAVITVDETLGDIYRVENRRVVVIGHYPKASLALEAAPVFSHETLNLLYIGRLSADRGILTYVEILRTLLALQIPARLHLAGSFTPAAEKLAFDHQSAGLEAHIELHGWVTYDQVPALLAEADVGLSILMPEPRYVAALPVKLFEYMAAGLPVVASNFPLIASVVVPAHCGILIDPLENPESIAAQLAAWWMNPELPRALGGNGRQAVLNQYNWEILASRLDELYCALLGKNQTPHTNGYAQ